MARRKKATTTTIDEKAKERREEIQKRTENTFEVNEGEVVEQPKFTEDGVKIEQNVFPPADENAEFGGTAAAQRELRRAKEEATKED